MRDRNNVRWQDAVLYSLTRDDYTLCKENSTLRETSTKKAQTRESRHKTDQSRPKSYINIVLHYQIVSGSYHIIKKEGRRQCDANG